MFKRVNLVERLDPMAAVQGGPVGAATAARGEKW